MYLQQSLQIKMDSSLVKPVLKSFAGFLENNSKNSVYLELHSKRINDSRFLSEFVWDPYLRFYRSGNRDWTRNFWPFKGLNIGIWNYGFWFEIIECDHIPTIALGSRQNHFIEYPRAKILLGCPENATRYSTSLLTESAYTCRMRPFQFISCPRTEIAAKLFK